MQNFSRRLMAWALAVALLLLIPLVLTIRDGGVEGVGWNWTLSDFVFMGILLFGSALAYELIARKGSTMTYRVAVGIAAITTVLLIWINAAVGIIGDGPANLMYLFVPVIGCIGALLAHFRPQGMSRALFVTALAQFLIPVIAFIIWKPNFSPGVLQVFLLNAIFVAMWIGSGLLFTKATGGQSRKLITHKI